MEEQISKEEIIAKTKSQSLFLWVLVGAVGALLVIVILLIVVGINLITRSNENTNIPVTITPTEAPPAVILPPSKFATDPAVLKFRDDLNTLRTDLDAIDLFETQLSPPSLDLKISIQSAL